MKNTLSKQNKNILSLHNHFFCPLQDGEIHPLNMRRSEIKREEVERDKERGVEKETSGTQIGQLMLEG